MKFNIDRNVLHDACLYNLFLCLKTVEETPISACTVLFIQLIDRNTYRTLQFYIKSTQIISWIEMPIVGTHTKNFLLIIKERKFPSITNIYEKYTH